MKISLSLSLEIKRQKEGAVGYDPEQAPRPDLHSDHERAEAYAPIGFQIPTSAEPGWREDGHSR